MPDEGDSIGHGQFVFIVKRGHLFAATPINDVDGFRPQPPRSRSHVNRRITAANHGNLRANLHVIEAVRLSLLDEREGI